jgi:Family of unknown function (DUF5681)
MMSGDSPPADSKEDDVGYRKPPRTMRFTKGQSGNPAGRPRGRHREAPYEAVLGQMVKISDGGAERRVTAAEALGRVFESCGDRGHLTRLSGRYVPKRLDRFGTAMLTECLHYFFWLPVSRAGKFVAGQQIRPIVVKYFTIARARTVLMLRWSHASAC